MPSFYCNTCRKEFVSAWPTPKAVCPVCTKPAPQGKAPVQDVARGLNAVVPSHAPPSPAVLENLLYTNIFTLLDERALVFVSRVCRHWAPFGKALLAKFVPRMCAHGSMPEQLKPHVLRYLNDAQHVQLAVDKFPFPAKEAESSLLEYMLDKNMKIDLSLGTPDRRTMQVLEKAGRQVRKIDTFSKMHNKIWIIDHEGVIVGSPNVSYSALEGGNIESFIHIRSTRVGALFQKYLSWLKEPSNQVLGKEVVEWVQRYNGEQHQLRLAMAPIFSITDFVIEELKDATKIIIRQFLISSYKPPQGAPNILATLCAMARGGVEIKIYLDNGAYHNEKTGYFVREAVKHLLNAGCQVYTQTPVLVVDAGAEKIQHDKLILAELRSGVMRTLLGSAGFTKDVICNRNAENFIATDSKAIYDSLMAHHQATLNKEMVTTTRCNLLDR